MINIFKKKMENTFKFNIGDIVKHAATPDKDARRFVIIGRAKVEFRNRIENIYLVSMDNTKSFNSNSYTEPIMQRCYIDESEIDYFTKDSK